MADSELINAANKLTGVISKLTGVTQASLSSVAKGTTSGRSLIDAGEAASSLVPGFGAVGKAIGEFAKTGMDMADDLKAGAQYGVYFNQNMGEFATTVLGARDSMESWQKRLAANTDAFSHLGSTMDISMARFGSMAKQLQDNPLAMQLEMTGIKAEELNDVLASNIASQKFVNFNDINAKKFAIDSTLTLVKEMDDLARVTGVSKEQQLKQIQQEKDRPDVSLMMLTLTQKQQQGFTDTMQKFGNQSERFRDLAAEMATGDGSVRSAQGVQTLTALNQIDGRIGDMLRESAKLSTSDNEADRARSKELASQVSGLMEKGLKDNPEILKALARNVASGDQTALATADVVKGFKGLGTQTAKEQEAAAGKMSVEEYEKQQQQKVDAQRKGLTEKGEQDTGAAAFRTAQALDRLGKDINAGLSPNFAKLNDSVGQSIVQYNLLNGVLRARTAEEASKSLSPEGVKNFLKGITGSSTTPAPATGPQTSSAEPQGRVTNIGRANGSIGTVNKWMEDWGAGTLVELHGKEGVVTQDQFKMIGENINGLLKQVGVNGIGQSQSTTSLGQQIADVDKAVKSSQSMTSTPEIATFNKTIGEMNEKFKGLSIDVTKLTQEMATGGIRTAESIDQLVKLGPQALEFTNQFDEAMLAMEKSTDTPVSKVVESKSKDLTDTFSDMIFGISDIASKGYDEVAKAPDAISDMIFGISDIASKGYDEVAKAPDAISDMIFGISDIASKGYDEVSKAPDAISDMFTGISDIASKGYDEVSKAPDAISDMFTGIGDIASKEFDKVFGDKKPAEVGGNVKYEVTKNGLTEEERAAKLKLTNTPEKVAERKAKYASEFGPGADVVGLKASHESMLKINDDQKNKITESITTAQNNMVSTIAQKKEEEIKAAAQTSNVKEPSVDTAKPEPKTAVSEANTENDVKSQLILLNKQMGQLLSYTMEVANNSKLQVRATKQAATNNIIG